MKKHSLFKNYYGFTNFGIDDSYDNLETIRLRTDIVLHQASDSFFNYPLKTVFDNAKKNAYHLFNNLTIHDRLVEKYLEKSMNHVKNCITNGSAFPNSL